MIEKETPTILNLVPRILTQTLVVNTDELRSANNTVSIYYVFYVSSQCYLKGLFSTLFNVLSFGEKKLVCMRIGQSYTHSSLLDDRAKVYLFSDCVCFTFYFINLKCLCYPCIAPFLSHCNVI